MKQSGNISHGACVNWYQTLIPGEPVLCAFPLVLLWPLTRVTFAVRQNSFTSFSQAQFAVYIGSLAKSFPEQIYLFYLTECLCHRLFISSSCNYSIFEPNFVTENLLKAFIVSPNPFDRKVFWGKCYQNLIPGDSCKPHFVSHSTLVLWILTKCQQKKNV